jgi:transposase
VPEWFPEITEKVRVDLDRRQRERPLEAQEVRKQILAIEERLAGWTMSLGNPSLPAAARAAIEAGYEKAVGEKDDLQERLAQKASQEQRLKTTLNPDEVIDALRRLDEVMVGANASLTNIELAKHIACIQSDPDGRVILRGTFLGVFEGGVDLLSQDPSPQTDSVAEAGGNGRVRPRRLARRRTGCVNELLGRREEGFADAQPGLAPGRFEDLPAEFVWEEPLVLPSKTCWAEENAKAVLDYLLANPSLSLNQIAKHFDTSRPTVSHALSIADPTGTATVSLLRTIAPRGVANFQKLVEPIGEDFAAGMGVMAIAEKYGVSYPTVDKALDEWHAKRGLKRPDGRTRRKTKRQADDKRA